MTDPTYCTVVLDWPCLTQQLWAAWIQAVGSIAAIAAAVFISRSQSRQALRLAERQGDQVAQFETARVEREEQERLRVERVSLARLQHALFDVYFEASSALKMLEVMPLSNDEESADEVAEWKRHCGDGLVTCELNVTPTHAELAELASHLDDRAISEVLFLSMTLKDYSTRLAVLAAMFRTEVVLPSTIEAAINLAKETLRELASSAQSLRSYLNPSARPFPKTSASGNDHETQHEHAS